MKKIPFAGIELTSQRVRGLRGNSELPGRPAVVPSVNVYEYETSEKCVLVECSKNCMTRVLREAHGLYDREDLQDVNRV